MLRRPNSALAKRKPCVGKNREWLSRVVAKNVNFAMIKGGNMTDYAEFSPIFMLVMLAIIGLVVWRWMRDGDDEPDYSVRMPAAANCDTENNCGAKDGCDTENDNATNNDNGKENEMCEDFTERVIRCFTTR